MDKTHRIIDVLLFDDVNLLDVAGPVQVFATTNDLGPEAYRIRPVSLDGRPVRSSSGVELGVQGKAECGPDTQDLLVPGGYGVTPRLEDTGYSDLIGNWLQRPGDRRVMSVCSGALFLAKAGLLHGRPATTHWGSDTSAKAQFPDVKWDTRRLYFDEPPVMTAAGVSSGIDLALAIVRRDLGPDRALRTARQLVVHAKRAGGQLQFADLLEAQFSDDTAIQRLADALFETPQHHWTLDGMAELVALSPRTLSRRCNAQLGLSPAKLLEQIRVKRATDTLSAGAAVGRALQVSGFHDFQQMNRAFKRQIGTTVGAYQDRFSMEGAA